MYHRKLVVMKKRRRKNSKKYLTILVPICIVLLLALLIFVGYNLIFKERTKKFLETIDTTAYVEINSIRKFKRMSNTHNS